MTESTLLTVGELLVEFVSHQKGCELTQLSEYSGPYPSGAPAIFADQAARCGMRSMVIGSVGKDGFGRTLVKRLVENGVNITGIREQPNLTTGVAFVSYNDDGSRNFIFHLTNTAADAVEFNPLDLPDGDLVLHVSGSSLGNPKLRHAILAAVEAVLARGGKICCDPNARPELMQDEEVRNALQLVIDKSSYLLPSTSDLEFLYPGLTEAEIVENLLANRANIIALKRGHEGVTVLADGERIDVPAYQMTEIDPTGAGDCFCGTFLACLLQGKPVRLAAQLANAAGAISVTKRGPMEGNSNLDAITQFIKSQNNHA